MPGKNRANVRQRAVQQLESLKRAGLTHFPRNTVDASDSRSGGVAADHLVPAASSDAPVRSEPQESPHGKHVARSLFEEAPPIESSQPKAQSAVTPALRPQLSREERCSLLESAAALVAACRRCGELAETRTQTVFGVGNPQARIVFIGEAPGADEDRQGEPFVGRAGQLLNRIIAACRLTREEIYICNILKCRPPGNRTPAPEEANNCREYLDRQLAVIDPEYIVCWGSVAAQNLLGTTLSIGRMRGRFYQYGRARVVCTYHPSYLLRNPAAKKDVWEDMKFLMREIGVELE